MADLIGGTAFGTLVHSVLERVDWQAPDLDGALGEAVDECLAWRPVELVTAVPSQNGDDAGSSGRASLIAGLRTALLTPLGPHSPMSGWRTSALATASPSSPSICDSARTAAYRPPDCSGKPSATHSRQVTRARPGRKRWPAALATSCSPATSLVRSTSSPG